MAYIADGCDERRHPETRSYLVYCYFYRKCSERHEKNPTWPNAPQHKHKRAKSERRAHNTQHYKKNQFFSFSR